MKILHVADGPLAGNSYELGPTMMIGRAGDSDIQVLDEDVSRRHACVYERDDGTVVVRDLGSANGTQVCGEAVTEATLEPRDDILIGVTRFVYREVRPETVAVEHPDIKLSSGPALKATVLQGDPDELAAALATAKAPACCDDPLAAMARREGWAHCPACGAAAS